MHAEIQQMLIFYLIPFTYYFLNSILKKEHLKGIFYIFAGKVDKCRRNLYLRKNLINNHALLRRFQEVI